MSRYTTLEVVRNGPVLQIRLNRPEVRNAFNEAMIEELTAWARAVTPDGPTRVAILQGAGSDAHVLPGLGTGAVRMREFRTPEEFLWSLRSAEILRRPKSLAYLQSLKWVAQVKEKVR